MKSSKLFLFAGAFMLLAAIIVGIFNGNSAIDIQLHDTYFVIAKFHIYIAIAFYFGFFALVYYAYPKLTGRKMSEKLGVYHFACSFIALIAMSGLVSYISMASVPRRYYSFEGFDAFSYFNGLNQILLIVAIGFVLVQLIFVVNFFRALWMRA